MNTTITNRGRLGSLLAGLLLAACADSPQLIPKSAAIPAGTDLSGHWQLRVEPGSRPPAADEPRIRIPPATSSRNPQRRVSSGAKRSGRTSVSVFLESGESLKITQTASGLFISFDRAVVEEYRFGEDRIVAVGPIEAQRVSGWQDGRFVTQTADDAGAILSESWELSEDGKVLLRQITVSKGDKEEFSAEQHFDRTDGPKN